MTTDDELSGCHISLEWRSEESSSEDDDLSCRVRHSRKSSLLPGQYNPSTIASNVPPTMPELGPTLSQSEQGQVLLSAELPPAPPDSTPHLPPPHNQLVPRGYQLELYRRACQQNTIAFLDTGAGKTLVAALLVKKTLQDLDEARFEKQLETSQRPPQLPSVDSETSTDVDMTHEMCIDSTSSSEQFSKKRSRDESQDQLMLLKPKSLPVEARKVAVFLVHRVPLVPQQAEVLQSVVSPQHKVGAYYGEKGVDDWSSSTWAKSLRSKSVLVMTAQIFLNLLRHGLIEIRNVALLIIDEVHHATKGHPYRRIFVEFYHTLQEGDSRPLVFGMTATPVKRKAAYSDREPYLIAIAELEATLDSTVVAVSEEGQEELETLVPKPEEFVITYKSDENEWGDLMDNDFTEEDRNRETTILARLAESQSKVSDGVQEQNIDDDGDVTMNSSLSGVDMKLVQRIFRKLGYKAAVDFATQLCRINDVRLGDTLESLFRGYNGDEVKCRTIPERVSKLLDVLCYEYLRTRSEREAMGMAREGKDQFQCIIFVQERSVALSLTWLINSVFAPLKCNELIARSVVGAQNSDSIVRMSRSTLMSSIEDFRRGKYGILVSTSVVEEGLDIPACRLVVAFDPVISPTSYIQGRGRARKEGARYVVFVQERCPKAFEELFMARKGSRIMNVAAKSDMSAELSRQIACAKNLKSGKGTAKILFSRTTSARVSATEALNLLHRYCSMKGNHTDSKNFKPTYKLSPSDGGFVATVTFHHLIPIDYGLSEESQETELLARRCAALDAYTKLYEIGEVDEHLLPRRTARSQRVLRVRRANASGIRAFIHRTKQRTSREVQSKASKKNKRVRNCNIKHPQALRSKLDISSNNPDLAVRGGQEEIETFYLYKISLTCDMKDQLWYSLRRHEAFGILVREQISEDDTEVIRCPEGDPLFTLSYLTTVSLSSVLQASAYKYVRFLQLCLRGRTPGGVSSIEIEQNEFSKSSEPGFFLVPLVGGSSKSQARIDWDNIQHLNSFGWKCGPSEEHECIGNEMLEHVLVCSSHENLDRVYLTGSLKRDITAESHPDGLLHSSFSSFKQYYEKKHSVILKEPQQVLLEGFNVRDVVCGLSLSTFMLAPETCRIIPVSPFGCFITSILPMWQTFLALRACWRKNSIQEDPVGFLTFARALQPNINNVAKKAVDLSYERLEFLGDAVLKVIYSMVTFVQNPDDSEGMLSDDRDLVVSNQRLADLALEMQIHHCVAFSGISQKAKSWPWYWATHQDKPIRISEKVLADCVEALIGAQYLHGGIPLATLFMDKHKLLPGASNLLGIEFGDASKKIGPGKAVVVDVPPMGPGDHRHESSEIRAVEQIIGYNFKNKRHLVVALTHGSFENGLISTYQRYEYLGDAIIGFLLLSHYFHKYPNLGPGELTSIRGPALSNDLFARVIVSCGLHRMFWHNSPPLAREITRFARLIAEEESDDEDVSKTITVPKVLGDLLESIIGAIVVDNGMHLHGVQDIVLQIMHEELSRFANPENFIQNPVSQLVRLIQQQCNTRPDYKYLESANDSDTICVICLNGEELGRGVGPTRRVSKRKASISSLKKLHVPVGHRADVCDKVMDSAILLPCTKIQLDCT